ncbi:MAG: glycosyltransferase family 4 protein [archaeon]
MRIAMIHLGFPPEDVAGGSLYVYNLANELSRLGHGIDVYTYKPKNKTKRNDYPTEKNVRVKRLNYRYVPLLKEKVILNINKSIDFRKYDLVHGFHPLYFTVSSVFNECKKKGIPFVNTVFDLGIFSSGITRRLRFKTQLEGSLKKMAFGTTISKTTEKKLIEFLPETEPKIEFIPPGIDEKIFDPKKVNEERIMRKYGIKSNCKNLLFVGRVIPSKGMEYLLEALEAVIEKRNKINLHVVGEVDANYKKKLEEKVNGSGLKGKVFFHSFTPIGDLPGVFKLSDLLVLPSFTEGEGFGLVVLEALAMGTPVITTEIVGSSYLIKENPKYGIIVKEKNSDELSNAIIELIEKKKAVNSRKIIEDYSWGKVGRKMNEIYERVGKEK